MEHLNLKLNHEYCSVEYEGNEIKIVFEDNSNNEDFYLNTVFLDNEFISIHFNNMNVGYIHYFADEHSVYLEHVDIKSNYRRKKIGYYSLLMFKHVSKLLNLSFIDGECRDDLISFYRKLGAKFESRTPEDNTYINNRFYIDLV